MTIVGPRIRVMSLGFGLVIASFGLMASGCGTSPGDSAPIDAAGPPGARGYLSIRSNTTITTTAPTPIVALFAHHIAYGPLLA